MKKILITGIQGFLGKHLKEYFKGRYEIYGIAREEEKNSEIPIYSSRNLETINLDPEYVIICHAAISSGRNKIESNVLYDVNIRLTQDIISKFSNSKFIYISTASIYRSFVGDINEKTLDSPANEYSISKYWAEKLVLNTNNGAVIRLSSLYGEGMNEGTIIPNYVSQALTNDRIEVWGEGNRMQNYIHIDDLGQCIIKSLDVFDSVKNKVLLAVHHKEYSNIELAKMIAEITTAKIEHVHHDNSISLQYNNKITQNLLNWESKADFRLKVQNYIKWKQKQS